MKIGNIEILPVDYGRFKLDGGAMFGVVPKVLWENYFPANDKDQINMALRGMLIRTGSHNILVDTGVGDKMSDKLNKIYDVDFSNYSISASLTNINLSPEDITDVILTHLHFDHTGGATIRKNNGDIVPAFPNALYYMQKKQYQWANSPSERDRASYFSENYVPLNECGAVKFLDGDEEIFPGVSVVEVNGHTPGQQLVKICSQGQCLLFCGDLIPTSAHVSVPWIMSYDLFPMVTLEEKKKILSAAASENWLLLYEHDPKIIASRVFEDQKGFHPGEKILVADV